VRGLPEERKAGQPVPRVGTGETYYDKGACIMPTPKDQNKRLATMLYEESCFHFGKLLWLASVLSDDVHCDDLEEIFDDMEMNKISKIFDLGIVADADEGIEVSDLAELLNNEERWGFLAEVLIPRKTFREDGSCSFSRASCYVDYAYAETTEELVAKAVELEKLYEEKDREKALKK
jgi:predicted HTH domain antitoxin